jgi:thiol-disulfide isomerase/thioredoxin
MRLALTFFLAIALLPACIKLGESFSGLPPGTWRGVLVLAEGEEAAEERSNAILPFNFEVIYDTPDSFHIEIINGEERIPVRDIRMGVDRRTGRDTVWIDFPVYDAHIRAEYEEDALEGWWVVRNRPDYQVRFKALNGQRYRFFEMPEPPAADLTGHWLCRFGLDTDTPDTLIGDFRQDGNRLTGTFLSTTGDYRFLEGTVSGDRMFLSVFDGSHAYLFEAKYMADGRLSGIYRSGNHYKTYWEGERTTMTSERELADPYALTRMKEKGPFRLTRPDADGHPVSVHDPPYAGRPRIIQVMGTWCPNCKDETEFLLRYLREHPDPGFDVIGISFERHTDTVKALQAIRTYREKMQVPYPILYGGSNQKDKASEVLHMLDRVVAYPTLIFLRGDGQVEAIHTGFSGPATAGYAEFVKEFEQHVSRITAPR